MAWCKTAFKGVRYRHGFFKKDGVEQLRKNGIQPDKYFALHYKLGGKVHDEPLGWASDGWNAEKAALKLAELKRNRAEGGPITLKESHAAREDKREAEAAKRKAQAEARKTLSEYWNDSYLPAAKRSKKQSSWEKEEQHFRLWIGPLLGGLPIRSIGLKQWDELVKTLSAAGLSPRMKEYVTGTLRRALKHAYDRRMVDEAPPTGKRVGVSGPGNNRRLRTISHEEESAIMSALELRDKNAWRLTRFVFLTGCRASEAFNLTWANVDFYRASLTFQDTKNHDSRTLPLTNPLLELFSGMKAGEPGRRVFTKVDETPYSQAPNAFSTVVGELGLNQDREGRDRVVFHSIRHTVATRLAQRLGPRDLMDVMGWRTVQMAMRYVHGNEDAKAKALSMLGTAPEAGRVLQFGLQFGRG